MLPDWVSNPGPLTYESGALPIALCGLAWLTLTFFMAKSNLISQLSYIVRTSLSLSMSVCKDIAR